MKQTIFLLFFLTVSLLLSAQSVSISGTINNQEMPFPGVIVSLLKDENILQTIQSDINGNYLIKNIEPGVYALNISYMQMPIKNIPNIELEKDKQFDFIYPEPCVSSKKICPKGHTDKIIPIVYGYPSKQMMKKADKEKVKLGGCDTSLCEKWHCKTHDLDF